MSASRAKRIVLTGVSRGLGLAMAERLIDTEMLRSCWGDSAGSYPDTADFARRAVPFILQIGPKDNGVPLSVPR